MMESKCYKSTLIELHFFFNLGPTCPGPIWQRAELSSSRCRRYSHRGLTAKMFAGLGSKGFESKGCFDIEGEIQPKIQDQTSH